MEGASWDARIYSSINGGAMSVEAYDNLEVYKYDNDTGDVLGYIDYADKDSLTYIYNEAGEVLTKELVSGEGAKTIYDKFNRLLSETKESGEAIAYTYDNLGNIISMTPQFPDGTSFTYYDSGAFQNEIKTASLPNGKILYYDYNINDSGDLKTYKRVSYDKSNLYQSFYSNTYIPSSENPVLKASFKLDNSKTSASVYASAYYYNYNDKSVSLYMNIYSSKPTISYYYYDYVSRQTIRDSRTLDITINRDISYNVEYVWASTGVNVYIYEASGPRPASPVYTIANSNWNPRFSISGTNSALSLDPASSGGYTASKSISTDYNDPLKGGPIHTATFSLNSVAASRSLYYNVYGSTASTYDSLYFSYYNNAPTLRSYHYDYTASQYTTSAIPLNINLASDITYTIQTKIENNTLKFYLYESGTTPSAPIYTIENVSWDPRISTSINGGDIDVEACDRLEIYEQNSSNVILLDSDIDPTLKNKNIFIDDPDSTLPEYTLVSGAPTIFPNGKKDIINDIVPLIDLSIILPGIIFDVDGSIIEDSDSADSSYFDTIKYSENRAIKEIVTLKGETIAYKDGLVDSILSGNYTTASYSYSLTDMNNINEISVDRDGIKRIYDKYGNIKSLSLDDATKIVYENGVVKEIQKADGTTIKNMAFRENGDLDDALVSYPDGSLAVYSDAELLQLISSSGDITDYSDGKIRKITLEDGTVYDWSYDGSNIIILDNSKLEKRTYLDGRLLQLEELTGTKLITKYYYGEGASKDLVRSEITQNNEVLYVYTYTYDNELTLVHDQDGNTQAYNKDKKLTYIIDSQGRKYSYTYMGKSEGYTEVYFPSGTKVRYDNDAKIIDITKSDGTVIKDIIFDPDNIPQDFNYVKGDTTYGVKSGIIHNATKRDGTVTEYYPSGFIKSVTLSSGEISTYGYDIALSQKDIPDGVGENMETVLVDSESLLELSCLPDPTSSLLLHFNGTDNSATSTDSSIRNNTMTFYGNSHVDTSVSRFGSSALALDGDGDYLTIPDSDEWNFGNGDFTIDTWVYFPEGSNGGSVLSQGSDYTPFPHFDFSVTTSGVVMMWKSVTGSAWNGYTAAYTTISNSSWHHVEYAKSGSTVKIFIDGASQAVYTSDYSNAEFADYSGPLYVGKYCITPYGPDYFNGYIDELRISKGVVRHASDFDPQAREYHGPYKDAGTVISDPIELNATQLNNISWNDIIPEGTEITVQTRTGDSIDPEDGSWSEWSNPMTDSTGSSIASPAARYLQYKISLATQDTTVSPSLVLGAAGDIVIGYTRDPIDTADLTNLINTKITVNDITSFYGKDEPESAHITFDPSDLNSLKAEIPSYILNDTQRNVYMKDDIVIAELVEVKDLQNNVTRYKQGKIADITKSDGTIIKDIFFDVNNAPEDYTYTKDSTTYIVRDDKIAEVIKPDGSLIKYNSHGSIISITYNDGRISDYSYETLSSQYVPEEGCLQDTEITLINNEEMLRLMSLPDARTSLLLHFNGTDNAATSSDSSTHNNTMTFYGNSHVDTSVSKFGSSALALDGDGDYLTIPDSDEWNFGNGDFTIDTWVYFPEGSDGGAVLSQGTDYTPFPHFVLNVSPTSGVLMMWKSVTGASWNGCTSSYTPMSRNTWHHVEYAKSGSTVKIFVDGESQTVNTSDYNNEEFCDYSGPLSIGRYCITPYGPSYFNGYIDELRISKGVVRHTSDFDPLDDEYSGSYIPSGSFMSSPIELNATSFNAISWNANVPSVSSLAIQTRTGNSLNPDDGSWSDWSLPVTNPISSEITSPAAKYLQYKVTMSTEDSQASPKIDLSSVNINYVKNSTDPEDFSVVREIKIDEGGIVTTYDNNGINIINSLDVIDVTNVFFDVENINAIKKDMQDHTLNDAQKVITVYDKGNDTPAEIVTAGQSITYFDDGFATKVVDKNGVTQVVYTYDDDKNIIKVEFVDARQKLAENYQKAADEIVTQKGDALAKLAQAEIDARSDIAAKSASIQEQIDNERARLAQEKAKYNPSIYDLSEFDRAFREIDDYETRLHQQTQDAYIDLDGQITDARARIEHDSSTAMRDLIENDHNKILADIVQKESSPLIYQYYRKVLGRDPGDDDLIYWTDIAKTELRAITATEITQYLESLTEYADRTSRKQNIITYITTFFTQYLSASATEKEAMFTSFGISPNEAVTITQEDIDAIISWLNGQSLHFGDSAFKTIISMLESSGINRTFEDIGKNAIAVDILTGVITKDTTGDLLISMYAMRKSAQANGFTLYSSKITYDDLKDMVSRDNVTVHIDGKHYVLVTDIDDAEGTIGYIDSTVGQTGQSITVTRAEFMQTWRGYSLIKELPADPSKQLNATQEKNIRGSGWWADLWRGIVNFFQKIIAPVATIVMLIPGLQPLALALHGLNIIIQTVSFVVKTGTLMDIVWSAVNLVGSYLGSTVLSNVFNTVKGFFGTIGSTIGNVFQGIGNALSIPLQGTFQAVTNIFGHISNAVNIIATNLGRVVSLNSAPLDIAKTIGMNIIAQGVGVGTNLLFKSMNLDPSWANIGSALISGAIVGMGNPDIKVVGGILRSGVIAGVEQLGAAIDLDPNITHLGAMLAGSLIGGVISSGDKILTYDQLMESITPNILSESAYIGMTEVGNLFGIDSRISYLAGAGIRTSISMGYGNDGIFDWQDAWGGIQQGLLQGVTSVGLEWGYKSLDLSPLLGSISASTIGATLEALLSHQNPLINIDNRAGEYLMDLGTFGLYDPQTNQLKIDPWSHTAYISKILDFSRIIREAENPGQGLITALETYSSAIFHQQAIDSIFREGGILAMITGRAEIKIDIVTGKEKKRLWTGSDKKYYVDIDIETGNFIEKFEQINGVDVLIQQSYGIDASGKTIVSGRTVTENFKDGFTRITNYDINGNLINIITNNENNECELKKYNGKLELDEKGNPYVGILVDKQTGRETYFDGKNGVKIYDKYDYLGQMMGVNIGGGSMLSPLYYNSALDTGETAIRLNTIASMGSDIKNTNSYLYSSNFSDMISKTQQYVLSDGSLDLSTFGDYGYWDSLEDLSSYFETWSEDINTLLSPIDIDETSTYEDIINSVEDATKIDELNTKSQELKIFFEFTNQMAQKAMGTITEISPAMFGLVKGLSIWTQDAYAFDGVINDAKSDSIGFLDKAYSFINDAGSLISDKSDILKEAFWTGIESGVTNVSPYFSTLSTFAGSVYDLAQGGTEISLDTMKSLGTGTWQNIMNAAGEVKELAAYFKYIGSLALTNPDLPFAQGALLSLIGGDTNTWSNLQGAADSAFDIANSLYDISSAFLNNTIDYATDIKDNIVNSTWWDTLKYSIIYNVDSVKDGFGYVTDKAIDLLTTNKDAFLGKVKAASQAAIYGQRKLMESFVELGKNMGLNAYEFWTDPNTISAIKNTSSNILNAIIATIDNIDPMQKEIEFFGLVDPAPRIETSSIVLKTAYVDQQLNWLPFYNSVSLTALDLITALKFGNMRWDAANKRAAPYYENFILQGMKGISLSGINDDGVKLDNLAQMLAPYVSGSFTITHSAGVGVLLNSSLTTDKVMIISPQIPRAELEAWIDKMGLTSDKVIIVDIAGDLPFRPIDLIDLSPSETAGNIATPAELVATNIENLINNNAYHDYSQNPNGKYTYVRIERGNEIGFNPIDNHNAGINGALNTDIQGNYYEYVFSVNGVSQGSSTLQNVYIKALRGDYR